ncbi:MAG: hypothetical protein J7L83_00875 [Thaumarchaeota archaeon]|nr:hypothetical protein [Nitrososphaerota archaeon]
MSGKKPSALLTSLFVLICLLAISVLIRLERGLLGVVLTGILLVLGFYWFKEIKRAIGSGRPRREYPLEITEEKNVIDLIAQVPGPEEAVSFEISGKKLLVRGGMGFKKVVKLPYRVRVLRSSYINGILHIKLVREEVIKKDEQSPSY